MPQRGTDQPKVTYLKDYRPPAYFIDRVELRFDLYDSHTLVTAHSHVRRNPEVADAKTPCVLDGASLKLMEVKINGASVEHEVNEESLSLFNVPEEFELKVVTKLEPHKNKALEGLYRSGQIYCTQCEAQGFRRITYYVDRPDNMAIFTTSIAAEKKSFPVLLSNGNLIESQELKDGRHLAKWHDPFKKPSYLFALVAGDLDVATDTFTTKSGRKVDLRVYVDKGRIDRCQHALTALKKAMLWDEVRFGLEYDLDIYMIVAVDDFNMGAMENKGLNIFNANYVLANPETATDDAYERIESIIAHEYFHNWSGNRVTCRDWFQLSLKEGLTVYRDQEFTEDHFSEPVKRIDDVQTLRTSQFAEDSGPNAHPVRPSSAISVDNFYTVTIYEKGAELIRMIETIVGRQGFYDGLQKYFELYDGQAVTTDEFVYAMEQANDIDLTQFKNWYNYSGTPEIDVTSVYNSADKTYTLTFEQKNTLNGKQECPPYHIPVKMGLIGPDGNSMALTGDGLEAQQKNEIILHLKSTQHTFTFKNIAAEPVPSLLRDFSAPVRLNYNMSDNQLLLQMSYDENLFNRWEAGQKLYIKTLKALVQTPMNQSSEVISKELIEAFGKNLELSESDPLFFSRMITLPSETYLQQFFTPVDPARILQSRQRLQATLAKQFAPLFKAVYEAHQVQGDYNFNEKDMAKRALATTCLSYLTCTGEQEHLDIAFNLFQNASSMTDTMSALNALRDISCTQRQQALASFYRQWSSDAIVFNSWLRLQSLSRLPDTLERIQQIFSDPHFKIQNPNNVFSLLGGLAMGNPSVFHDESGDAYQLLADKVIELDRLNPQVAAHLAEGLSHWKRFGPRKQELMKAQLNRLIQTPGLSKNTFEIVNRSLK